MYQPKDAEIIATEQTETTPNSVTGPSEAPALGRSMQDVFGSGPLPPEVARSIFIAVCEALESTASGYKGILHPSQFRISETSADAPHVEFKPGLEDSGFGYASPEETVGQPGTIASNVYSLGLMLLEALAGTQAARNAQFHSISRERLHELGVPSRFEAVLIQSLSQKCEERFQTIADFRCSLTPRPYRSFPIYPLLGLIALIICVLLSTSKHQNVSPVTRLPAQQQTLTKNPWPLRKTWHTHTKTNQKITAITERQTGRVLFEYPGPPVASGMVVKAAVLKGVSLRNADLRNFNFDDVDEIRHGDFAGADLTGSCLSCHHKLRLVDCNFRGAIISNVGFYADLVRTNFSGAKISNSSFAISRLENALFDDVEMDHTDFFRAQLVGSSFRKTHVETVSFSLADLRGCDLSGAVVTDSDMQAKFDNCNFEAARFTNCFFSDDLKNIKYDANTLINNCVGLRQTGTRIERYRIQNREHPDIAFPAGMNASPE